MQLAPRLLSLGMGACLSGIAFAIGVPGHGLGTMSACAASLHHAGISVEHADGSVMRVCVGFDEAQITGEQLLQRSGIEFAVATYGGLGDAICQVDHEPQSYPLGCWTSDSQYWATFVSRGGGPWKTSGYGISTQTFADGDVEGFRYESQSSTLFPPSPAGICDQPSPTAAPARVGAGAAPPRPSPPVPTASIAATPALAATAANQAGTQPRTSTGKPVAAAIPHDGLSLPWIVIALLGGGFAGMAGIRITLRNGAAKHA